MRFMILKERALAEDLWDYCFEKRTDPFFTWYFSRYCQTQNILGLFKQEQLAAMAHLNPHTLSLGGQAVPVSYLVGVAVAPQFRRQGLLREILAASFAELAKRGQPLAILQPIAAGLYTPYGFSYCYYRLKYSLPLEKLVNLPPPPRGYDFSMAKAADWPHLKTVYSGFTAAYDNYAIRDERRWRDILEETACQGGHALLVRAGGQTQGYLLYALKDNCFQTIEMAYLNNAAKLALLSFAAQHISQCADFSWLAPADDLTFLDFKRDGYYPLYRPFMMGRIVDPAKAVALFKLPPPGREIAVELTDSIIKENNAVFSLKNKNGLAGLTRADAESEVKLDVGAFAQLCFGAHSPHALYAAGLLKTADRAVLDALEAVFPAKLNYINEYV